MLEIFAFVVANWWWISLILLIVFSGLKLAAVKTRWVWDDAVITYILGLIRMSRGKDPFTGNDSTMGDTHTRYYSL